MRKRNTILNLNQENVSTEADIVTNLKKEELPCEVLVSKIRNKVESGILAPTDGFDIKESVKEAILENETVITTEDEIAIETFVNRLFLGYPNKDILENELAQLNTLKDNPSIMEKFQDKMDEIYKRYEEVYKDNGGTFSFRFQEFKDGNLLGVFKDSNLISKFLIKAIKRNGQRAENVIRDVNVKNDPYNVADHLCCDTLGDLVGISGSNTIKLIKRSESISLDFEKCDDIFMRDDEIVMIMANSRDSKKPLFRENSESILPYCTFIKESIDDIIKVTMESLEKFRILNTNMGVTILEGKDVLPFEREQVIALVEELTNVIALTLRTINNYRSDLIKCLCNDHNLELDSGQILHEIDEKVNTD